MEAGYQATTIAGVVTWHFMVHARQVMKVSDGQSYRVLLMNGEKCILTSRLGVNFIANERTSNVILILLSSHREK